MTRIPLSGLVASVTMSVTMSAACTQDMVQCNVDADCDGQRCRLGSCVDVVPVPLERAPPADDSRLDDEDDTLPGCGAMQDAWFDDDGDGFSGRVAPWCADEALPSGAAWAPSFAPVHLIEPEDVDAVQGQWDLESSSFYRTSSDPVGEIVITDFACAGALEGVAGVEIVVTLDGPTAPTTEVTVQIEADGIVSQARTATIEADGAQLDFGGAADAFGLSLTPAQVCDAGFTIHIRVAPESGNNTPLEVRAAAVRVYGAVDCDDLDDQRFSPASLRADADQDGFAGGLLLPACVGLVVPAGQGVRDLDCAPDDASAYPGQSVRFARERFAVGGFDFDCDGDEEPLDESVPDMSSCTISEDGSTCNVYYSSLNPACGQTISYGDCYGSCSLVTREFTQLCR